MWTAALIIFGVMGGLALLIHVYRVLLTLREDRPRRFFVPTPDGWQLSVHFRPAVIRRFREPVVLCHGLANNHRFFDFLAPFSMAAFLSHQGFDCYSVDLRGAGDSRAPDEGPWDASVDDHINFDAPALVEAIRAHAGAEQVLWVGHSLGGLVGLASSGTTAAGRVRALVTIGSPASFVFKRRVDRLIRLGRLMAPAGRFPLHWLAELATPIAGRVDLKVAYAVANLKNIEASVQPRLMANVFAPIWKGVLTQLEDWVTTGRFASLDGAVDYRAVASALTLPILVTGGSMDRIAPPEVQQRYFESLGTPDKKLRIFGTADGDGDEYGHGDLIIGKRVAAEVYPVVAEWLVRFATPA